MMTDVQELMAQIDAAFVTSQLSFGCRLQGEFRTRFGRDPWPAEASVVMLDERWRMWAGSAGVRSGGT
jgi:hypothetical protein